MPTSQGTSVEHDLCDISFTYDHLVGVLLATGDGEFQVIVLDACIFPPVLGVLDKSGIHRGKRFPLDQENDGNGQQGCEDTADHGCTKKAADPGLLYSGSPCG